MKTIFKTVTHYFLPACRKFYSTIKKRVADYMEAHKLVRSQLKILTFLVIKNYSSLGCYYSYNGMYLDMMQYTGLAHLGIYYRVSGFG